MSDLLANNQKICSQSSAIRQQLARNGADCVVVFCGRLGIAAAINRAGIINRADAACPRLLACRLDVDLGLEGLGADVGGLVC